MSRPRKLLLLALLLVLALVYAWTETPRQQRVSSQSQARIGKGTTSSKTAVEKFERLDFSGGEKLPLHKPKRDLFGPLYAAPKPASARVVAPKPMPRPVPVVTPHPVVASPSPMPPAGPKPIQPLKVLGFLRKEGSMVVFLGSQTGDVYIVRQGDRFADDLLVRQLTPQKVVVSRGQNDPGLTLTVREARQQRMKIVATPSSRPNLPSMQDLDVNQLLPDNANAKKANFGGAGEPAEPGKPIVKPAGQ